ncbi:MAG: YbgC/FadM family acyl-CoA thioesterase [Pseudomonadota bacterium]
MNVYNVTVFLEDTDAGGVVYHARYLNFMERCRTRFFYHKGIDHAQLITSHTGHFLVSRVGIDFIKPACLGDELAVTLEHIDIRGASIECVQRITRQEQLLVKATVTLVFVNPGTGKPIRMPELLKAKMH